MDDQIFLLTLIDLKGKQALHAFESYDDCFQIASALQGKIEQGALWCTGSFQMQPSFLDWLLPQMPIIASLMLLVTIATLVLARASQMKGQ